MFLLSDSSTDAHLSTVWNTHARISKEVAQEHIAELSFLTPATNIASPFTSKESPPQQARPDLDAPEELSVRLLLLGILHRTAGEMDASRDFLLECKKSAVGVNTWVPGVATFELAVLELKQADVQIGSDLLALDETKKAAWRKVLKSASDRLAEALSLAPQSVDLSSRLDMRVAMLKDEVALKRDAIDGVA